MNRIKHYKAARNHLDVELIDAKKVVDRLYERVEMEPDYEASFSESYERVWDEIQEERRREKKRQKQKRRDQRARKGSTVAILHRTDGTSDRCIIERPMAEIIVEARQAWAENPRFAYEEYTFGNIAADAILEVHHELLDGTPIGTEKMQDIEYLKLRPAE